jgi:GT2 family glycosyltransferase
MVRGDAFDRVGALDEGYFHSFEDTDWCFRARRAGLEVAVVLGAVARHGGGRTLGAASPLRLYYAARAHLRAAERMAGGARGGAAFRAGAVVAVNAAHALRQRDVPRMAAVAAVARAARDFRRGAMGPAAEQAR